MKKKTLFIIAIMFVFITHINASEMCEVISGTGKNIGDEIKCGTESFYVLSNDGETVKLFAKYNLDTGVEYTRSIYNSVPSKAPKRGALKPTTSDNDQEEIGLGRYYEYNDKEYQITTRYVPLEPVKQAERAIGMYQSSLENPLNPEYGVYPIGIYGVYNFAPPLNNTDSPFKDYALNNNSSLDREEKKIYEYLEEYKSYLNTQGFNVSYINIITVNEINEVIKKETGNNIALEVGESIQSQYLNEKTFKIDYIKDLVGTKLPWLYQTTYWTRTGLEDTNGDNSGAVERYSIPNKEQGAKPLSLSHADLYIFFVDTFGYLGVSAASDVTIGAGIRPIVVLDANQIKYAIRVIEKPEGTVEVVKSASAGDRITFKLQSKPGYKLSSLTIKTAGGINVSYDAGELIMLEDGTIAINDNAFTMPADDVIIEPTWVKEEIEEKEEEPPVGEGEVENPKTGGSISWLIIIGSVLIILGLFSYSRNRKFYRL